MDHREIQSRMDNIAEEMSEKGLKKPRVALSFDSGQDPLCYAYYTDAAGNEKMIAVGRGYARDLLGELFRRVGELPDERARNLHDFMAQLGKLIDSGRAYGIELEYLNPLSDSMKRLSENVITHQPIEARQPPSMDEAGVGF